MKYKHDLFICFPEESKDIAEKFRSQMEAAGLKTFMYYRNLRLRWGDLTWAEIENAIDNSLAVLPVLTKESLGSSGVKREIDMAIAKQKKIYPLFGRYTQANEHHPISQIFWRKLEDYDIPTLAQEIIDDIHEIKKREKRVSGIVALGALVIGTGIMYLGTREKAAC